MQFEKIEVEATFDEFSRQFRGGGKLSDFVEKIPQGYLNADYYFREDKIIAELKTLEGDAFEPEVFGRRIVQSVERSGYSFKEYLGWIKSGQQFPDEVLRRLNGMIARPIRECIKKATKQIATTRRILDCADANGVVLIANSGNYGLDPINLMTIADRAFSETGHPELDCLIYFTPNVLHRLGDNDIGHEIWVPVANNAGDELQKFIDKLGAAWFDHCERIRPSTARQTGTDLSALLEARVTNDRPK